MLFHKFTQGEKINKTDFSKLNGISERSFDRDIEDIRNFLAEIHVAGEIRFNKADNVYYLSNLKNHKLSSIEVITIMKVLLGARVLRKDEMQGLAASIRMMTDPMARKEAVNSIYSELDNYVSPVHGKAILKMLEYLTFIIQKHFKIDVIYTKATGECIERRILPLIFIFSDFYFYLIAFIDGAEYKYPAFFRVDRIESFKLTDERYSERLYEKYNAAKMRNCLQFMYAGELLQIKVKCKNKAVEAFKDRLPNHWFIADEGEWKVYGAKVFGEGFIRWALLQGSSIEILEPIELRKEFIDAIDRIYTIYKSKEERYGQTYSTRCR